MSYTVLTNAELDEQIAAYQQAHLAIAVNQEYSVGSRRFTRANIAEVRKTLELLGQEKSRRTYGMTPGMQGVSTRVAR